MKFLRGGRALAHPARIVTSEDEKAAAFRRARAALAASGTVTLELALSGVPHVAAYRVSLAEGLLMRAIARPHPAVVRSVVLANLLLGETVVPEFLQTACNPETLAATLIPLLEDSDARRRQVQAFSRLDDVFGLKGIPPSKRAARAVLDLVNADPS